MLQDSSLTLCLVDLVIQRVDARQEVGSTYEAISTRHKIASV